MNRITPDKRCSGGDFPGEEPNNSTERRFNPPPAYKVLLTTILQTVSPTETAPWLRVLAAAARQELVRITENEAVAQAYLN